MGDVIQIIKTEAVGGPEEVAEIADRLVVQDYAVGLSNDPSQIMEREERNHLTLEDDLYRLNT